MKVLYSFFLMFFLAGGVSGQAVATPPAAHKVTVIEKKWDVEVSIPALEEDPMRAINETRQLQRDQIETKNQNDIRTRMGLPTIQPPVRMRQPEAKTPESSITYIYKIKVRNNAEKAIQSITWEYVFFEPETDREVGRLRFESKENIRPNKAKDLVVRANSPPTGSISAREAGKKPHEQYIDQIIIQKIEYADGSVWKAAPKSP